MVKLSQKDKEQSQVEEHNDPASQDFDSDLKMSSMLLNLYASGQVDQQNVSIPSSFITLLHLANETNLSFTELGEKDFIIEKGQ